MIGTLHHVAVVVRDLEAAIALYRDVLGADVSASRDLPEHGVRIAFVDLPGSLVELMTPIGTGSPIAGFLEKTGGGLHHICYEVANIAAARDRLRASGLRLLGGGDPKIGAHGKPVLFLHPKDCSGTLIELQQG